MADSPEQYVIDACALIAYLNNEVGADKVEQWLIRAEAGEVDLYVSAINLYEIYYDAVRRSSPDKANELLHDLYSLPITIVQAVDELLMQEAGYFKATYRISLADSIALGLARQLQANLVTSDHHEFDAIDQSGDITFFWLR